MTLLTLTDAAAGGGGYQDSGKTMSQESDSAYELQVLVIIHAEQQHNVPCSCARSLGTHEHDTFCCSG